jgi:hypothetical protein
MKVRNGLIILIAAVSLSLPAAATGMTDRSQRESLKGVKAVEVAVKTFRPEIREELMTKGVTEDLVEVAAVRQLEKAGVRITRSAMSDDEAGRFVVSIQFVTPDERRSTIASVDGVTVPRKGFDQRYAYAIRVDLVQIVALSRDASSQFPAVTWTTSSVAYRKIERLIGDVSAAVTEFIEDHQSENP